MRRIRSETQLNAPSSKLKFPSTEGIAVRHKGVFPSESFRVFFEKNGNPISPVHDIPLFADEEKGILNMVVEIPKWTNAKLELAVAEKMNPIKQDVKGGKPRFVNNVYPYKGYIWNYGAFPQTWEDPTKVHSETGAIGDSDPLDCCEIGSEVAQCGQIKQVKPLGVLGMIDQGEMDWKVLAIDVNDPLAAQINDIEDLQHLFPGLLHATFSWFRTYKVPDGKTENLFAFRGEARNREYAMDIVLESYQSWQDLVSGRIKYKFDCSNTTLDWSPMVMTIETAGKVLEGTVPGLPEMEGYNQTEQTYMEDSLEFMETPLMTVKRHAVTLQRQFPHGTNELSLLISEIGTATKCIGGHIRDHGPGPLQDLIDFAEAQMFRTLSSSGLVCVLVSSRQEKPLPVPDISCIGNYVVAYNPLVVGDCSTLSMGTIFGIYYRKSPPGKQRGDSSDVLQRTGYEQVAAGYCYYGSSTMLVYTMGFGVHTFTFDPFSGHYILNTQQLRIPKHGKIYSVSNSALSKVMSQAVHDFVKKMAESRDASGMPVHQFRYEHSLIENFHRILHYGGILMMPGPKDENLAHFLGEAAPLAFLTEQAGGRAIVASKRPVLGLSAWTLTMRVPVFIGSSIDVDELCKLMEQERGNIKSSSSGALKPQS
mmetsp:Transcript_7741/g.13284  ORF Transcript_7741/g.13284 Transcript_7741/m.13284 type:complete len:649 (+) Transcript_7741:73-2019(+)